MTLHRPGGHEHNLATTGETQRFAAEVSEFAKTISPKVGGMIKGPLHQQIGRALVSASSFSDDLMLTISFAPLGSDDLRTQVEEDLASPGKEAGFRTSVVDAHNSIGEEQESPDLTDPGWKELFAKMEAVEPTDYRISYSHSAELGFKPGEDLTENGIGVFLIGTGGAKHVLVLADANNAVPDLRGMVASTLESSGFELVEFCTSDSHNLAARGLTVARGYKALGEDTDPESLAKVVLDLAKLAEGRATPSMYSSGSLMTRVRIFGSKALEEFASITQSSSRLGRAYLRFGALSVGVLLLVSLTF